MFAFLREHPAPPRDATKFNYRCECCLQPFEAANRLSGLQRNSVEYEVLRKALMIQDHTVLPVFCDPCFEQAIVPPESRNVGFPNPLLEKAQGP